MELVAGPKKIMIIEDDPDIREIMTVILEEEGYAVIGLANGSTAFETIEKMRPATVLLDVQLGDMDGRDICKALKEDPATKDIPVIIVSATHGLHTAHEKRCGADDYLNKPFDLTDLIGRVKRYAA